MKRFYAVIVGWLGCLAAGAADYHITSQDLTPVGALSGAIEYTSDSLRAGAVDGAAALWSGPDHIYTSLHPAGATYSEVLAGAGNQQGGYTYSVIDWGHSAALWTGTKASYRNLNPSWSHDSMVVAMTESHQAGYATTSNYELHAGVWSGTAASFVDLNPAAASDSAAYAIAGNQQAGEVTINGRSHAALWSGTVASFVDLNPPGAGGSEVRGMSTTQQVGQAGGHAGIWFSTATSFVDLQPDGAEYSEALATIDSAQAGYAVFDSYRHAVLWLGAADNYIDLQLQLGSDYRESQAYSVWSDGSAIYVAGSATDIPGYSHPMLWELTPVPEPGFAALTGLGLIAGLLACRHKTLRQNRE